MRASAILCLALVAVVLAASAASSANVLRHLRRFQRLELLDQVSELKGRDRHVDFIAGAMDEESYFTIADVLKAKGVNKPYDDVYIIERCTEGVTDFTTRLWERPMSVIAGDHTVHHAVLPGGKLAQIYPTVEAEAEEVAQQSSGTELYIERIRKQLSAALEEATEEINGLVNKKIDSQKSTLAPCYHLYSIGDAVVPVNRVGRVAIVHRIAEMGLETSLVFPLLMPVLKSLKAEGTDYKINLFAVAAGGVTFNEDKPGSNHLLHSSLLLGITRKEGDATKVHGYVDLATDDTARAITHIKENVGEAAHSDGRNAPKAGLLTAFKALKDSDLADAPKPVSLTLSYFGGADEKTEANRLKIQDVNMEDFLYIDMVRRARETAVLGDLVGRQAVFRVDCDPFSVEPFVAIFKAWAVDAAQKMLPKATVKKIIKWGLDGLDIDNLPAEMEWNVEVIFAGVEEKVRQAAFIKTKNGKVINPFMLEMATDLIKDSAGKGVGNVKTTAVAVLDASKTELDAKIDDFLNALKTHLNGVLTDTEKVNEEDSMPYWMRGKWKVYFSVDLEKTAFDTAPVLNRFKPNDLGVDRVFYKASNFPGLQAINDLVFHGDAADRTPYDYAVRKEVCPIVYETTAGFCDIKDQLHARFQHMLQYDSVGRNLYVGSCDNVTVKKAFKDFCIDDARGANINKF